MAITQAKKELEKKRALKKKEKAEKKEDRKSNNNKGKSFEDMLMYVDENGNLTTTPPDKQFRKLINASDIAVSTAPKVEGEVEFKGVLTNFFEDKGYGFIKEDGSGQSIFVHVNQLKEELKAKDIVVFEKENTPKGISAVNVRKVK